MDLPTEETTKVIQSDLLTVKAETPVYGGYVLSKEGKVIFIRGAVPGEVVEGTITAINPQVENATRNVLVQATVANKRHRLRPGMFVNVSILLPEQARVLVIPSTAVLNAPYSDSAFNVEPAARFATDGNVIFGR